MSKPLLGKTTTCMQKKSSHCICKIEGKERERKKYRTLLPNFELSWLLPHFHGVRDSLLELVYLLEFVKPPQLPPSLFCIAPPSGPHPVHSLCKYTA